MKTMGIPNTNKKAKMAETIDTMATLSPFRAEVRKNRFKCEQEKKQTSEGDDGVYDSQGNPHGRRNLSCIQQAQFEPINDDDDRKNGTQQVGDEQGHLQQVGRELFPK